MWSAKGKTLLPREHTVQTITCISNLGYSYTVRIYWLVECYLTVNTWQITSPHLTLTFTNFHSGCWNIETSESSSELLLSRYSGNQIISQLYSIITNFRQTIEDGNIFIANLQFLKTRFNSSPFVFPPVQDQNESLLHQLITEMFQTLKSIFINQIWSCLKSYGAKIDVSYFVNNASSYLASSTRYFKILSVSRSLRFPNLGCSGIVTKRQPFLACAPVNNSTCNLRPNKTAL